MNTLRLFTTSLSLFAFLMTSLPISSVAQKKYDLSPNTREFLGVLQEGPERENIAEHYRRVSKYLPKEVNTDFGPYLENKGKLQAPHVSVEGGTVTYSLGEMKLVMEITSRSSGNTIVINGKTLTKKDFSSVKNLVNRIDRILTEQYGARPKTAAAALFSLLVPQAQAQMDWMPLLLGGALGAAGGYYFGGTTGALLGGAVGAAIGYFFFSGKKCPKTPECCWDGGNSNTSYHMGCCSELKMTKMNPVSICTDAAAAEASKSNTTIIYQSAPSGSSVPQGGTR